MWFPLLFADIREDPLRSPEVIWGVAGLTVALLVGAAVIYAVDRWRKRAAADPSEASATDALTSYRAMYESGEITEEEYARLRDRVAEKVKRPVPKPDSPVGPVPPVRPGERVPANPPAPPPRAPEPPGTA
ncbi:MAG: SHOCT domain-containing protein [Planctomycetes bacterium]|nr:SHOCT domain-containing protein [Planctomycetota bacterium]